MPSSTRAHRAKEVLSLWSSTHRSCTTRVGKLAIALQSQNVLFSSVSEVLAVRRDVRLVTFVTIIIVCRGAVVSLQRRHDAHHLGRMSLFRNIPQWPSSASSSSSETYTTNSTPPLPSSSSVHHATINSARSQRTCCWRRGSLRRRRCTVPQLLAGGFRVTQHTKRRLPKRKRVPCVVLSRQCAPPIPGLFLVRSWGGLDSFGTLRCMYAESCLLCISCRVCHSRSYTHACVLVFCCESVSLTQAPISTPSPHPTPRQSSL